MSAKDSTIFKMEIKHSNLSFGCENGSEGQDEYSNCILPFNIGDTITKGDKQYTVTIKDWDYDNNTIWFIAIPEK